MNTRSSSLLLGCLLIAFAQSASQAANVRYAPARTMYVKLQFEGDPGFPSLTSTTLTRGLDRFTGAAFGLSQQQREVVVQRIQELVEEDFRDFNVEFVTGTPPMTNSFTWGIDDSKFLYPANGACTGSTTSRLWGKAGSLDHQSVDCTGESLYHPSYARTFAGSFVVLSNSDSPSQPPLRLGQPLPPGPFDSQLSFPTISVEHIAQALANSAAHEIGHLFGLKHPEGAEDLQCKTSLTFQATRLMCSSPEGIEARFNKGFSGTERAILAASIGLRPLDSAGVPGALRDRGAGLTWTAERRLISSVSVGSIVPTADSRLSFADARAYVAQLDYLGYDDWRLPSALEPSGHWQPCRSDYSTLPIRCSRSELGHLYFDSAVLATGPYWSTSATSTPWIFTFAGGRQYPASSTGESLAQVWPVRQTGTLIDNGDGTITDTANRKMWIRDFTAAGARRFMEMNSRAINHDFAGHSDWRLPRIGKPDRTCTDPGVFELLTDSSGGCDQSELGRLMSGWGITATASAPFVLPPAGGPIWFDDELLEKDENGRAVAASRATFSFADGVVRTAGPDAAAFAMLVRDLDPGDLPRGERVIVEPTPGVIVRLRNVTSAGVIAAELQPAVGSEAESRLIHRLSSQGNFDRSPGAVEVCLRYGPLDGLSGGGGELRVAKRGTSGIFEPLPAVAGYPDVTNKVACGRTNSLGEFRVVHPGVGGPLLGWP
jgi:hypothetical protein